MSRSRAPILAIHLAGWGLFLALPLLFMQGFREEQPLWPMLASYDYWQFSVVFMGLFYLNAYGLFPRLYLRGHRVWYFLVVLALLGGIHLLKPFEQLMRTRSRKAGREWTRSAHGPGQDKLFHQPPFA